MEEYSLDKHKELLERRVSPQTKKTYLYWLEQAKDTEGKLTKESIKDFWYEKERTGMKGLNVVKAALKMYCIEARIRINFPRIIKRRESIVPKYYSTEMAQKIIDLTRTKYRLAYELMLKTGMRVGEVNSLHLSQINASEEKITVMGKGSKERIVYPGKKILYELMKHYEEQPPKLKNGWIFPSTKNIGKPVTTKTLRQQLKKPLITELDERPHPHKLRHSFAIRWLQQGKPLPVIQAALGHTNVSTTSIYTRVHSAELKKASEEDNL